MSTVSRKSRSSLVGRAIRLAVLITAIGLPPLVVSGCGKASAPAAAVTRTDSAGVQVVTNSGPDHLLGWSLDSLLSIRSPTGQGADTLGFFGVNDVAVAGGHIVVLDRSIPALVVFDSLGHVQGRYGRKGHGPGEFEDPISVAAAPKGGVGVFDFSNRRIERFDTSFASSGSIGLGRLLAYGVPMRFAGAAAVLMTHRISGDSAVYGLDAIGARDTTVITNLHQERNSKPIEFDCGFQFPPGFLQPVFAPDLRWTPDPRGDVVVARSDRYDIGVYAGPRFILTRRIRRDEPPIRATQALAMRSLGQGWTSHFSDGTTVRCTPEDIVEHQGFAPTVPPLGQMAVAPDGDLWVHRFVPAGDSVIDVFDSTGVYRGTLNGTPMPVAFLGHDRMIVKRTDSLDVAFLTIYRVVR